MKMGIEASHYTQRPDKKGIMYEHNVLVMMFGKGKK
jgi:hypothetical protein